MSTIIKSVSISLEMNELIEKYKISPSEAIKVGLSVMLSELGELQYINKLNIGRKLNSAINIIKEQQEKINQYEEKNVLEKE